MLDESEEERPQVRKKIVINREKEEKVNKPVVNKNGPGARLQFVFGFWTHKRASSPFKPYAIYLKSSRATVQDVQMPMSSGVF